MPYLMPRHTPVGGADPCTALTFGRDLRIAKTIIGIIFIDNILFLFNLAYLSAYTNIYLAIVLTFCHLREIQETFNLGGKFYYFT